MSKNNLQLRSEHLQMLRKILMSYVPDAEVFAYGSRVNGDAHDASDLDIVIRNPKNLLQKQTSAIADLRAALSESNLPLLVDVHDWAALPEEFHKNISEKYFVIQTAK